jgi:T-complex protein 1 subunit alpha
MASKILRADDDHFAPIVLNVCLAVNGSSAKKCPVYRISIVKSFPESSFVASGIAIEAMKAGDKMLRSTSGAWAAVHDLGIARTRLPTGITSRLKNADKLNQMQSEEVEECRRMVDAIMGEGRNVIVASKTVEEASLKLIVRAGAIGIRYVAVGRSPPSRRRPARRS